MSIVLSISSGEVKGPGADILYAEKHFAWYPEKEFACEYVVQKYIMDDNYCGILSSDSINVILTLLIHSDDEDGFVISPSTIQKRFKFGEHKWRRISKELKEEGLFKFKPGRPPAGESAWELVIPTDNNVGVGLIFTPPKKEIYEHD